MARGKSVKQRERLSKQRSSDESIYTAKSIFLSLMTGFGVVAAAIAGNKIAALVVGSALVASLPFAGPVVAAFIIIGFVILGGALGFALGYGLFKLAKTLSKEKTQSEEKVIEEDVIEKSSSYRSMGELSSPNGLPRVLSMSEIKIEDSSAKASESRRYESLESSPSLLFFHIDGLSEKKPSQNTAAGSLASLDDASSKKAASPTEGKSKSAGQDAARDTWVKGVFYAITGM